MHTIPYNDGIQKIFDDNPSLKKLFEKTNSSKQFMNKHFMCAEYAVKNYNGTGEIEDEMRFLKKNLDISDIDIEFYYDLKAKLMKNAEHKRHRRESSKGDDSNSPLRKPAGSVVTVSALKAGGEARVAPSMKSPALSSHNSNPFKGVPFAKKDSLPSLNPNPGALTKTGANWGAVAQPLPNKNSLGGSGLSSMYGTNHFGMTAGQKQFLIKDFSVPARKSSSISKNQVKPTQTTVGIVTTNNTTLAQTQIISPGGVQNSRKIVKPTGTFSWLNSGDQFTLTNADNPYLTDPFQDDVFYKGRKGGKLSRKHSIVSVSGKDHGLTSTNSSMFYNPKGSKVIGDSDKSTVAGSMDFGGFLQTKEPYMLHSQADFYKKTFYPKEEVVLPKKPQVITRSQLSEARIPTKQEIKEYLLRPPKDFVMAHSKGVKDLENQDFDKHIRRLYRPLFKLNRRSPLPTNQGYLIPVSEQSEFDGDEFDEMGVEKAAFRSLVIKKYVFDNTKNELDIINKLLQLYENKTNNELTQELIQQKEQEKTARNRAMAMSKGKQPINLSSMNNKTPRGNITLTHVPNSLGYSRVMFDKENDLINYFLHTMAESTSKLSIDQQTLIELRKVISKRLTIVNSILENLDYNKQIDQYLSKQHRRFMEDQAEYTHLTNAPDLVTVGAAFGEDKKQQNSVLKNKAKINEKRRRRRKHTESNKGMKEDEDSDMETESFDDGSNNKLKYRAVLDRKINIDKQQFKQLCIKFIRKEVRRIKHAHDMQKQNFSRLRNPNRNCKTSIGFSENLFNLLKQNKEDLPIDLKEDLVRLLPETTLKELGNDMFIEDQRRITEFKIKSDFLEDIQRKMQAISGNKDAVARFGQIANSINSTLGLLFAGKENSLLDKSSSGPGVGILGNTSSTIFEKLALLKQEELTDEQKKLLEQQGLVLKDGKVLIQDEFGNQIEAAQLRSLPSPEKAPNNLLQGVEKDLSDIADKSNFMTEDQSPSTKRNIKTGANEGLLTAREKTVGTNGSSALLVGERSDKQTDKIGSYQNLEDSTNAIVKNNSIQMKLGENFMIVDNDVFVAKVKVVKPKQYQAEKKIILPTVYNPAEIKLPVRGRNIDKPMSASKKEHLDGDDPNKQNLQDPNAVKKPRIKRRVSAMGYREKHIEDVKEELAEGQKEGEVEKKNLRAMLDDLKQWNTKFNMKHTVEELHNKFKRKGSTEMQLKRNDTLMLPDFDKPGFAGESFTGQDRKQDHEGNTTRRAVEISPTKKERVTRFDALPKFDHDDESKPNAKADATPIKVKQDKSRPGRKKTTITFAPEVPQVEKEKKPQAPLKPQQLVPEDKKTYQVTPVASENKLQELPKPLIKKKDGTTQPPKEPTGTGKDMNEWLEESKKRKKEEDARRQEQAIKDREKAKQNLAAKLAGEANAQIDKEEEDEKDEDEVNAEKDDMDPVLVNKLRNDANQLNHFDFSQFDQKKKVTIKKMDEPGIKTIPKPQPTAGTIVPPVRPPELIFEKDDKNIKQMLQSPPPQLNIPKIMSDKDMREYLRNEFKRLSKNLENVDYDKLDDQSKFNYILYHNTKEQLMRMMKYTESNIQEAIMGRKDCNEELRDFFDENMQKMYVNDYNQKFTSQVNEPILRKEQKIIELIKSATLAGDKEKLKILQEFGTPVFEAEFEKRRDMFWRNYQSAVNRIEEEAASLVRIIHVPFVTRQPLSDGEGEQSTNKEQESTESQDNKPNKRKGPQKDMFEFYKQMLLKMKANDPRGFVDFMDKADRVIKLHDHTAEQVKKGNKIGIYSQDTISSK